MMPCLWQDFKVSVTNIWIGSCIWVVDFLVRCSEIRRRRQAAKVVTLCFRSTHVINAECIPQYTWVTAIWWGRLCVLWQRPLNTERYHWKLGRAAALWNRTSHSYNPFYCQAIQYIQPGFLMNNYWRTISISLILLGKILFIRVSHFW